MYNKALSSMSNEDLDKVVEKFVAGMPWKEKVGNDLLYTSLFSD